ncbi:MAG: 50S ribosomal protein L35 [Anaerolineaceae bacterium]|nr:50S ribosomal protein L35 [Anaerolineaceae bacterium]
MPKIKTHKGSRKRMKVSKTGKVLSKRAGKGHLMSTKSGKRRRALGRSKTASPGETRRYVRAITGR